ncbi:MAG: DUF167 domain-containing protein [bacterium]|nr:DUF167 domain-containing protein [Candidatus Sumerlaeota bacterium]
MTRTINVKAHPKAKHEKIERRPDGSYEIWTTAAPEKGAANELITRMLARELGVAPSRVMLRRGASSRNKVFVVE